MSNFEEWYEQRQHDSGWMVIVQLREAYNAGARDMQEKCAEVADKSKYLECAKLGKVWFEYKTDVGKVIRKLEV
jgi:peptidyl-tRNA hydrolase